MSRQSWKGCGKPSDCALCCGAGVDGPPLLPSHALIHLPEDMLSDSHNRYVVGVKIGELLSMAVVENEAKTWSDKVQAGSRLLQCKLAVK